MFLKLGNTPREYDKKLHVVDETLKFLKETRSDPDSRRSVLRLYRVFFLS